MMYAVTLEGLDTPRYLRASTPEEARDNAQEIWPNNAVLDVKEA